MANVAPMMAEQYTPPEDYVDVLSDGEQVIVDREGALLVVWMCLAVSSAPATVQRIMSLYYASMNWGGLVAVTSTFAEKVDEYTRILMHHSDVQYIGFWLAFSIPAVCTFRALGWAHVQGVSIVMPLLLLYARPSLVPSPSPLLSASPITEAMNTVQAGLGKPATVSADASAAVRHQEGRAVLDACRFLLFFAVY